MRTFIGIRLEDTTITKIEKVLKPVKKIATPIRWVKAENIHVTLKFIGEIPHKKYRQIEDALNPDLISAKSFEASIVGLGKFGRGKELNILWAGVQGGDEIQLLFNQIETTLDRVGIPKESRKFTPHITLGRNRRSFNFKPVYTIIEQNKDILISRIMVDRFQVFRSDLSPQGPEYTILKEICLAES